jgi:anti-sigma B factor antagonist
VSVNEQFSDIELLRVKVVPGRTGVTVRVAGNLDVSGSHRLRDTVDRVLATRPRSVTIDASRVLFVDSAGMAALLSARHAVMTEAGLAFRVIDPSPALLRVVEMTGFQKLLSEESRAAAP